MIIDDFQSIKFSKNVHVKFEKYHKQLIRLLMKYLDNETIISKHFNRTITLAIVIALITVNKPTKNN